MLPARQWRLVPLLALSKWRVSDLWPERYLGVHLRSWGMWFWDQPCVHSLSGHMVYRPAQALFLIS